MTRAAALSRLCSVNKPPNREVNAGLMNRTDALLQAFPNDCVSDGGVRDIVQHRVYCAESDFSPLESEVFAYDAGVVFLRQLEHGVQGEVKTSLSVLAIGGPRLKLGLVLV